MSLYVIAELLKDDGNKVYKRHVEDIIGYRIYDNKTRKYIDASSESIITQIRRGTVVNGLKINKRQRLESICSLGLDGIRYGSDKKEVIKYKVWVVVYKCEEGVIAVSYAGTTRQISFDTIKYGRVKIFFANVRFDINSDGELVMTEMYPIEYLDIQLKRSKEIKSLAGKLELLECSDFTVHCNGEFLLLNRRAKRIRIPTMCKKVPKWAFKHSKVESVSIGCGVREIGRSAFEGCQGLEEIEIPSSVKRIGIGCFKQCSCLHTVKLNEGLERIGSAAFQECNDLNYIRLPRTLKGSIGINGIFSKLEGDITIDVPSELVKNIAEMVYEGDVMSIERINPNITIKFY